jgi:hypothetical protein
VSPGYTIFDTQVIGYSPIAQPISGLGLGVTGPFMNGAFLLSGILTLAGIAGLFASTADDLRRARIVATALLALIPIGMIGLATFTLERPIPHLISASLALISPALSFPAAGLWLRGIPRWRTFAWWLIAGGPLTLVLVIAYFVSFDQAAAAANTGVAGLTERFVIIDVSAYLVAIGSLTTRPGVAASAGSRAVSA